MRPWVWILAGLALLVVLYLLRHFVARMLDAQLGNRFRIGPWRPWRKAPDTSRQDDDAPPQHIAWLADAPLFLDGAQVAAFYDAVVRPEMSIGSIRLESAELERKARTTEASIEAEISVGQLVKKWFPGLDAKVTAKGSAGMEVERSRQRGSTIELRPIETPRDSCCTSLFTTSLCNRTGAWL